MLKQAIIFPVNRYVDTMRLRKTLILVWLFGIFTAIAFIFWHNEFVYSLPTPVPGNYKPVIPGNTIRIPETLQSKNDKPVFLHFFNPDCPCSKFNMKHFRSLVKQYGNEAAFSIVVLNNRKYTAEQIQNKFDVKIPVSFDTTIAISCGVYSTPQAVIIDNNEKLYYRGNYNKSRYCTDKKSNYAQLALENFLHNKTTMFNQLALKAYGCSLPTCPK